VRPGKALSLSEVPNDKRRQKHDRERGIFHLGTAEQSIQGREHDTLASLKKLLQGTVPDARGKKKGRDADRNKKPA